MKYAVKRDKADQICSLADCNKQVFVKTRGWCKSHYSRWWRNGSPTGGKFIVHHGMVRTPIHTMWMNIKSRCYKEYDSFYYCYGGRGIKMFELWIDNFMLFHDYIISNLGERPSKFHSIDRIDVNGNYEPGNLRWASSFEQAANRRNTTNTSGYRGVSWKNKNRKWQSAIRANGLEVYLGLFSDPEEAALAYDCASIQLTGDYGSTNLL